MSEDIRKRAPLPTPPHLQHGGIPSMQEIKKFNRAMKEAQDERRRILAEEQKRKNHPEP